MNRQLPAFAKSGSGSTTKNRRGAECSRWPKCDIRPQGTRECTPVEQRTEPVDQITARPGQSHAESTSRAAQRGYRSVHSAIGSTHDREKEKGHCAQHHEQCKSMTELTRESQIRISKHGFYCCMYVVRTAPGDNRLLRLDKKRINDGNHYIVSRYNESSAEQIYVIRDAMRPGTDWRFASEKPGLHAAHGEIHMRRRTKCLCLGLEEQ